MQRAGFKHARFANLYGLEWEFLNQTEQEGPRDIDVLFVGNLSATVQGSRLPWLARIAQLADRHSVVLATRTFGNEYRDLLGRSKIAFNRSIRGECNKRTFESPAMGCLLFQEAENSEVREWLTEGEEYVGYTDENLEQLLEQLLADEPKRQAIAAAGRARVQRYGFEQIWDGVIARLQADWPAVQQRAASRAREPIPVPKPLPAYISATLDARDLGRAGQQAQAISLARQSIWASFRHDCRTEDVRFRVASASHDLCTALNRRCSTRRWPFATVPAAMESRQTLSSMTGTRSSASSSMPNWPNTASRETGSPTARPTCRRISSAGFSPSVSNVSIISLCWVKST
jgi:Glycosyl transferases group 1